MDNDARQRWEDQRDREDSLSIRIGGLETRVAVLTAMLEQACKDIAEQKKTQTWVVRIVAATIVAAVAKLVLKP